MHSDILGCMVDLSVKWIALPFNLILGAFRKNTRRTLRESKKLLIAEFRAVANESGSFIYSCVSASTEEMRNQRFDAGIHALLERVDTFMNHRIKDHCIKHHTKKTSTSMSNNLPSLFIIGSLLEDLYCLIEGQFDLNLDDIRDQFNTLIEELTFLLSFLKDIEKSQVTHTSDEMQESVIHIIDATYEAEYLINSHTAGRIPSWYLNLRLPIILRKIQITRKRIQETDKIYSVNEKNIQALRYPEEDASNVVGFEDIGERILADLVGGARKLQIISVIGMSGIGKTTIAKKLYNGRLVRDTFDLHMWCTISQTFEKKKVLDEIWISLTGKPSKDKMLTYESLVLGIYKTLFGRKYLIIMDDVWDSRVWDDLRSCFPDNGNGSRILFTSQIKHSAPAGIIFHSVPLLSNSQCYDLLRKKVFVPPESLDGAKGIASKCHGLPLTVVVVAGILENLEKEEMWKNVETNLGLYVSHQDSSMRVLELSYKYLPSHLKPCFLTLGWSFIPEDIRVKNIIPLWISHGFVEKEENKSPEEIAEEYVLELINRNLLIVTKRRSDGGIKACRFHDLIFDMCHRTAHTERFLNLLEMNSSYIYREQPHLYIGVAQSNTCNVSTLHCRSVSSFISAPPPGCSFSGMPLLRVYDTQESRIDEKRVSGLVQLRYLRCGVRITQLPEGISKLVKLEYLLLYRCDVVDVPSSILKMVKLKQIHIGRQIIFLKDCDIAKIRSNVKSLSCVRIRTREDEEILKCTPYLQKLKCISEGLFPDLSSLTVLESLNVSIFESPRLKGEPTQMYFPSTLKKVTLSGTNLPWEESSALGTLPNLQVLKLLCDAFCGKEWETRDDEFQELRYLKMHNIFSLRQWTSYSEHFPKLRNLVLGHIRVEIPVDFGNISTLQSIEVSNCGNEVYTSANLIREEQLEYENEDLKIIISDTGSKHVLVEDEVSAPTATLLAPQQEQPNMDHEASPSILKKYICQSCNTEINNYTWRFWEGSRWHDECFCCHACKQQINDSKSLNMLDGRPCHISCYKELNHPKCDVCKDFVPITVEGELDFQILKFWDQKICPSHMADGTLRCCGCHRFEPIDATCLILDDVHALCLECKESSIIMNTEECQALCMEIRDFFEGLNIKVKQDFPPVVFVDREAVNEATKGGIYEGEEFYGHVLYKDRGADLTRIQLPKTTTNHDSHILALLVQYGLPRLVTRYCVAWVMMDAWMSLEFQGYRDSSLKVQRGICSVLSHMWLEHETLSISSNKWKHSEFEKKFVEYLKYIIENDFRDVYRDGFREGKKAVDKYGMKPTLDHIGRTGVFPT